MTTAPAKPNTLRVRLERIRESLCCGRAGCACNGTSGNLHCPAHEDKSPSLSVTQKDGKVLVHCHAGCSQGDVLQALRERGLSPVPGSNGDRPKRRPRAKITRYEVQDTEGRLVAVHAREDHPDGKRMWWERPDGTIGLGGLPTSALPLYGAETLPVLPDGAPVAVNEGEKPRDALRSVGIAAAGTVTGAAGMPGDDALRPLVRLAPVLWADNDEAGCQHMARIAARLNALGCVSVRLVDWPGAPPKGDAADALRLGVDVVALINAAQPWEMPPQADAGCAPVLAQLLDAVVVIVRRYVMLSPRQADASALWDAHAHAFAAAETTPYLAVRSPEKRSGKTRLLEVLENVVPDPLKTENISVAALVHSVDQGATLLLDEVDSVFGKGKTSETQEMLRGILDSGYRVGGSYVRMTGQGAAQQVRRFSTFSPKALAGIGSLPGTIDDRSIILTLKRKAPHEKVERFRSRDARQQAAPLCQALARWAAGALDSLRDARPDIPGELDDRAQDSWEPLLAIADMAGGDWPKRARDAALELSAGVARQDDSIGVRLLADIRQAFNEMKADRLFTADVLQYLNAIEESPWGGFGESGMTGRELSRHLKRYGIAPKQVRINQRSLKGYEAGWFTDAWTRYCPLLHEVAETSETSETLKLIPICQPGETTPPKDGNVSLISQIQPRYDVSDVSLVSVPGDIQAALPNGPWEEGEL